VAGDNGGSAVIRTERGLEATHTTASGAGRLQALIEAVPRGDEMWMDVRHALYDAVTGP
jgi:hypothetical protein